MTKVVVVVDAFREVPIKEFFEGKDLRVNDPSQCGSLQIPILTILDGDKELASFKKWSYWRKTE